MQPQVARSSALGAGYITLAVRRTAVATRPLALRLAQCRRDGASAPCVGEGSRLPLAPMNAAAYLHSWSGAPGARDHGASAALSRWVIAQDVDVQKVFGWLSEQTDQHAAAETIENEAAAERQQRRKARGN